MDPLFHLKIASTTALPHPSLSAYCCHPPVTCKHRMMAKFHDGKLGDIAAECRKEDNTKYSSEEISDLEAQFEGQRRTLNLPWAFCDGALELQSSFIEKVGLGNDIEVGVYFSKVGSGMVGSGWHSDNNHNITIQVCFGLSSFFWGARDPYPSISVDPVSPLPFVRVRHCSPTAGDGTTTAHPPQPRHTHMRYPNIRLHKHNQTTPMRCSRRPPKAWRHMVQAEHAMAAAMRPAERDEHQPPATGSASFFGLVHGPLSRGPA